MINKSNLKLCLECIGFSECSSGVLKKNYPNVSCEISVDFNSEKIIYPSTIIGGTRNDGFDAPENFVVLECVNRLLDKGYRPEHIELEKEWHLGHDAKGGRADICLSKPDGSMLAIIECKTYGREYDKALKDTNADGGQLFSYWQQERSTNWLVLYTSDLEDNKIIFKAPTISCFDDPNVVILERKDSSIKLFSKAYTAIDKYKVWKDTYLLTTHDALLFSDDSVAYNVGVKPLLKKDLKDFKPEDKIVNKFEEILRHNNVSDKENAFNRLIALFICKLVDEITKGENDIVEFQYKQGTDTYETLQDRLQRLHKDGMEKFMKEKIFYVRADYPEWLFKTYGDEERKNAIEDLKNTIRILKFYSNNDFSFKDVHNEELFYQNGKILVEVVQLFEKYRIVYPSKHQFLGDLFEQLLNKGFKQNEGQFFTPMPITRFIWDSLPLSDYLNNNQDITHPKVIDYACGAGHFLTEAVEAINAVVASNKDNSWVRDHIFGIEKDYRLARVSKISLFMNGAGEGNIIFGDGLENYIDKKVEPNSFDLLVANPPYSVSSFKQHLQIKNNSFEILKSITDNGGEIETLFIERISQLLKPKGLAAVVLPSSILTNNSESYIKARESVLRNFNIRAIVQLGGKTFGATGTNTVVLFLEKYNEPPKFASMLEDNIVSIFKHLNLSEYNNNIYEPYISVINANKDTYDKFRTGTLTFDEIIIDEYFKTYCDQILASKPFKDLLNSKSFSKLSDEEKDKTKLKFINDIIVPVEKDKLLFFALSFKQKTVLITSPSDNSGQKEFLGYEWSERKGSEGIKIFNPGGKLYCDANRFETGTLSSLIRSSFNENIEEISEENSLFATVFNLSEMLDFTLPYFDKNIKTSIDKKINLVSKYDMKKIGEIVSTIESGNRPSGGVAHITSGALSLGGEHIDNENGHLDLSTPKYVPVDFYDNAERGKLQANDVLICKDGARTGKVAIVRNEIDGIKAMLNEHVFLLRTGDVNLQKYLYEFFVSTIGQELLKNNVTGAGQGGLNSTNLKNIKIPLPDSNVIAKVVSECEKIEQQFETTRMSIDSFKKEISEIFAKLNVASIGGGIRLADLAKYILAGGDAPLNNFSKVQTGDFNVPIYSNGIGEKALYGFTDIKKINDTCITVSARGTIGYTEIREAPFFPIVRLIVICPDEAKVDIHFLKYYLNYNGFVKSGTNIPQLTIPMVENAKIVIPSLNEQKIISSKIIELENKILELENTLLDLNKQKAIILGEIVQIEK